MDFSAVKMIQFTYTVYNCYSAFVNGFNVIQITGQMIRNSGEEEAANGGNQYRFPQRGLLG